MPRIASNVKMCIQAKITLTNLNENVFPVKRFITLNQEISSITVGRASKSPSKALHSAINNAWFDSPVMSRDHAEISLDIENKTLLLRDVGSMHGTFVNNSQLVSKVPITIRHGDEIVFGAEVKRGSETFPPCRFLIQYEISPCKATNTFAFPESSDFEDDDEIDINGDSTGQDQTDLIPYETRIRSEASLHAEAQTKNAAIFIRNKSPVAKQEGVISMVSQDLLSAHDKKTETLGVDSQWSKKLETTVQKTETASSFLKDEREKLAHDLDSHSSENLSKPIWKKEMSATIGSDHDDHPQKYTEYFLPKFESKTKFNYTFGRTEDFDLLGQESQIVNLSEDESDIQSSQGYLKTSGEGHENSIETETPSKDGCISLVAYNQEYTKNRMRQSIDWYDPTHDSIAVVKKRAMHSPIKEDLNPLRLSNESVVSEFEDRESTMINPRSSMTAPLEQHHDTRVEVCNGNTSKELWGDELGEKSGKTAYFRAREFNKAKFHSMGCFPDDTGSSHKSNLRQVLRQASLAFNDPKLSSEENLVHKSSATIREHSNQNAISTSNRCALNKKAKYQNLITEGTDQASEKIDTTDTNNSLGKATIPTNGSHSDNEVHDHVKTEMRASASENHKKRKAEVITEIINEDQCPRANPFPTFHHKISSNFENNLRQEENPPATDVAIFSRPSKRQKVFEKLGYVALGGFATAVGLFSALVATAPDFE